MQNAPQTIAKRSKFRDVGPHRKATSHASTTATIADSLQRRRSPNLYKVKGPPVGRRITPQNRTTTYNVVKILYITLAT